MAAVTGVLRKVGVVAGVVALAASVAITAGATAPIAGASLSAIAMGAGAAAGVANMGAQMLASKPPAQGSVSQTTIGTDQPSPCLIGRTYYAGSRVHLTGYGATRKKVKNPYLLAVDVHSVGGPVAALEGVYADFALVGSYFSGFLFRSHQLGMVAEASALALHWAGAPGWSAASRLSGKAAIAYQALFDKDGEVFASGFSPMGAVWRGVLCYDPRKDSTYPGGSGPHRWADPADTAAHDAARATWEWSENPGLHALHYALGRWERDPRVVGSRYRKTFGAGLPIDGLHVDDFVHLANVCDANGWACGGVLFEPTSSKWDNLKRILAAGGAEPAWRGGRLGVKVQAPRIALDTVTADDLADGELVVGAMQGWEQRLNTLIPKYRSEAHRWEYVATTEPVRIASYLTEDGEEKLEERQIDLCQSARQASQLCAYELMDRRELGEIELPCKPRLRRYGPGDLLIVHLPEAGLVQQPCVVLQRSLDPQTMGVGLVLRGETVAKHAFALAANGTAPATPTLAGTEDRDGVAAPGESASVTQLTIAASFTQPLSPLSAPSDVASIVIADHTRRYADRDVPVTGATLADLSFATVYFVGYDDPDRSGGAVTYQVYADPSDAGPSPDHPGRHFVGQITTPSEGGEPATGGGGGPPWWKFDRGPAPSPDAS